jgi:hypothetical protein
MKNIKLSLLSLALLGALSTTAQASDQLSYSFVEAGYAQAGEFDLDEAFNGYGIRGSVALGDNWYLVGDYYNTDATITIFTSVDNDLDIYDIGVGYHHGLSDKTDFFVDVSYSNIELSNQFNSFDDSGYRARLGFRGQLASKFEGSIAAVHRDFGDFGNDSALQLGGLIEFNETFGLSLEADLGDETRYFAGLRASW